MFQVPTICHVADVRKPTDDTSTQTIDLNQIGPWFTK